MVVGKSLSKTAQNESDLQPAVRIKSTSGSDRFCVVPVGPGLLNAYIVLAARLNVNVKSDTLLRGGTHPEAWPTDPGHLNNDGASGYG